jgi:hypothetical protein
VAGIQARDPMMIVLSVRMNKENGQALAFGGVRRPNPNDPAAPDRTLRPVLRN